MSDKIAVLENILGKIDKLFIGGGMVATFIKAMGAPVGDSLLEMDKVGFAQEVITRCTHWTVELVLPQDVVVASDFRPDAPSQVVNAMEIPDGWRIMDIGPESAASFNEELEVCKSVLWNGPMGVFEFPAFSQGTRVIGQTLAAMSDAVTIVGGGSTAEAVAELGLVDKMTHVSTGGGASLEFFEGKELPGVAALMDK